MSDSGQPTPQGASFGIKVSGRFGRGEERFLDDIRNVGTRIPDQARDVPPDIRTVSVIQRGPGVPVTVSQTANDGRLVRLVEQGAVSSEMANRMSEVVGQTLGSVG